MSVAKYLATRAEAEARQPPEVRAFDHVLVVPLYDEPGGCLTRLRQHISEDVLTVAVVNAPAGCSPEALARSAALLPELQRHPGTLVVPRLPPGQQIPARQGVGLARKIGSDLALALIARGKVRNPWIYQTDADAVLPANYFTQPLPESGACVFSHSHHSSDRQLQYAADLYDQHMNYYVAGLRFAGSSYAYPTLGSTISIHARTYAEVRGYPRRNAAEDFYLLNKAAKVVGVAHLSGVNVKVQARLSHRVPFGTGPALAEICCRLRSQPSGASYLSYNPRSFHLLKAALTYLQRFAGRPLQPDPAVAGLLEKLGFAALHAGLHQRYSRVAQRQRVLREWFDAFKQLRFIHEARALHPDQPLLQTLSSHPFNTPEAK